MRASTPASETARALAAETEPVAVEGDVLTADDPGSDFMVDVIKSLGIEYVAANPGSSFRSLHESIVNYGGNTKPELLTCLHEESSVGIAHGYAKAAGKPMAVMAHGTVGLQHAAMAVYNAWCDRVPILMFAGNGLDANKRRPGTEWNHSVQDCALMVRDYVKWDDQPASLTSMVESFIRGYRIATTEPQGPIYLCWDAALQEHRLESPLQIPPVDRYAPPARTQADPVALDTLAGWLVRAENPIILADYVGRNPDAAPSEGASRGIIFREGTAATVANAIVTSFTSAGLIVDKASTASQWANGALAVRNSIFWSNPGAGW